MSNNEAETTKKPRKGQLARKHILVEIEENEDGTIKSFKNILPMPNLPKGPQPVPDKIKNAIRTAARSGSKLYENKTLMVFYYTSNPFTLVSEVTFNAIDRDLKMKSGFTDTEK